MSDERCRHCRSPIPAGARTAPFCCRGCATVHQLLTAGGLDRYYELAGDREAPPPSFAERPASHAWLEPQLAKARGSGDGPVCELRLDVQGIHCAACVWLFEELFRRAPGAAQITVNPALGQVALRFDRARFDAERWVSEVERFGYRFGPARKRPTAAARELPLRLGISAALTLQLMIFSLSFYFGLAPADGELFPFFSWISFGLATAVALVGGWPFFRGSLAALRRGVLHLDLPIATGIALVWASSAARFAAGRGDHAYFDTLGVFISLMLAGRLLQERLLERNRRYLLEDDGVESLVARRIEDDRLEVRPAAELRAGDLLLVSPGELVPVDAVLAEPGGTSALVSTDWIDGESRPRLVTAAEPIAGGSFNADRRAVRVRATTDFADSPLVGLLGAPRTRPADGGRGRLWDRLARAWVVSVVAIAGLGFLAWLPAGRDAALSVAAALLVVTCPCALGIAVPLAYELTFHRLRRAGAYVRSADLLDRLPSVRRIVFDKTGTLTLGELELAAPAELEALAPRPRDVAFNLAARSTHPVSRALATALAPLGAAFEPAAAVEETPGRGLEWRAADGVWRLGRGEWAAGAPHGDETLLSRNGAPVARFATVERLRPDAVAELAGLAGRGHELWLLSGDRPARVAALAARLGFDRRRALGGQTPHEKAARLAALDRHDTLYLGDGVNDAPAFAAAYAAGTPAVDRPVMPARSDFFLVGEGLAPLAALLDSAAALRRVVRRLLGFAVAYNLGAVVAALAGLVSPLVAAVVMPASTLTLVGLTAAGLRRPAARPAADAPARLAEATP